MESLARFERYATSTMVKALRCTWEKALLESGAEIEEILKWQIGMQSANDVELRHRLAVSGSRSLESLV